MRFKNWIISILWGAFLINFSTLPLGNTHYKMSQEAGLIVAFFFHLIFILVFGLILGTIIFLIKIALTKIISKIKKKEILLKPIKTHNIVEVSILLIIISWIGLAGPLTLIYLIPFGIYILIKKLITRLKNKPVATQS